MSMVDDITEQVTPRELEKCEIVEDGDDCRMAYYGVKIRTVEDLIADAEIDLDIWEIVRKTVNNWEVAGKIGDAKNQSLWKTGNRQIKVELKRRAPKPIQDAIRHLMANMKPVKLPKTPKYSDDADLYMMEAGIHDAHFAKLCYAIETGTNYDLKIAEAEFRSAVDEMVRRAKLFKVELIHFPVGSDLFHYNSEDKTTANATPMATSADDRITKVFKVVCRCLEYAITQFLKIAPVDVFYIAGNHDRTIAWFATEWLAAKFDHAEDVSVMNSPTHRKYALYGPSLLGYTHGDEMPHERLAGMMAQERPDLWAQSRFRSFRTGHFHKKKETRFNVGDTHNGVEIYVFPSLGGTDSWHYRKGFVGNSRMAEVHFWSKKNGPAGMFYIHAKEPRVELEN